MARPRRHPRRSRRVREAAAPRYEASPAPGDLAGVLLDSNIVIAALRGRDATASQLHALEESGVGTYCCAVSSAEVLAGIRPGEEKVTEEFLEARAEVTIHARIGRRAGRYLAQFAKSHGVDVPDALVAATAVTAGLHLWTLNRRHYPMEDVRFYEP